ncbi:hypothetical protein ACIHCV_29155 [Streptomyces sp. NPDC051956]|uniref:hypothetical protein n=1 Tax=Streptomyces sp. NPDC051956 TaxID=3365677 RepID=UPI0037D91AD1
MPVHTDESAVADVGGEERGRAFGQDADSLSTKAFSAWSVASCRHNFVAVQSVTYVQRSPANGGSHCAGSWSASDRFVFADTAVSERGPPSADSPRRS